LTRKLQLELLEHHPIKDAASGLNEPSGLALDRQGTSLYTVSDETKIIFNLDLQGRIISDSSFLINVKDLEGLAVTADDKMILAVQEESNSIIQFDIISSKEIQRIPLTSLKNYDQIAMYFNHKNQNKGLEGITINFNNNHIFVVKEGEPGLLIELDSKCETIINHYMLNEKHGFIHPRIKSEKLDFSGLSYDHTSDTIWITSDKGECLFHFNFDDKKVLNRLDLPRESDTQSKRVAKSEGIAFDPTNQRFYIVSERDCELYIYQLHDHNEAATNFDDGCQ
jgi:uncharacterized protein YjiK